MNNPKATFHVGSGFFYALHSETFSGLGLSDPVILINQNRYTDKSAFFAFKEIGGIFLATLLEMLILVRAYSTSP